ncbi:hypothetical protein NBRC116493_11290 [Aurantivibrio infirmus]
MRKKSLNQLVCLVLTVCAVVAITGCGRFQFPGVYKVTVQQGNIITQEMVDQLKPGMTKRQVNFILGTPLIIDSFQPDRWDYLYTLKNRQGETSEKKFTVYFKEDQLTHFAGDFKPSSPTENTQASDNQ